MYTNRTINYIAKHRPFAQRPIYIDMPQHNRSRTGRIRTPARRIHYATIYRIYWPSSSSPPAIIGVRVVNVCVSVCSWDVRVYVYALRYLHLLLVIYSWLMSWRMSDSPNHLYTRRPGWCTYFTRMCMCVCLRERLCVCVFVAYLPWSLLVRHPQSTRCPYIEFSTVYSYLAIWFIDSELVMWINCKKDGTVFWLAFSEMKDIKLSTITCFNNEGVSILLWYCKSRFSLMFFDLHSPDWTNHTLAPWHRTCDAPDCTSNNANYYICPCHLIPEKYRSWRRVRHRAEFIWICLLNHHQAITLHRTRI